MPALPLLLHLKSLPLRHHGDCALLGVTPDHRLYVEEIYGDDDWVAQHILNFDGEFLQSEDENWGRGGRFSPLLLPPDLHKTQTGRHTTLLNYTGARHRGLRQEERIQEAVRPLSMPAKMALVARLGLGIPAPMVLGVAESYVLSETIITPPDVYMVCRRLRIAYALMQPQTDDDKFSYDYDTHVMYIAHFYHAATYDAEVAVDEALAGLPGVQLKRPIDCLRVGGHLFIAEGGDAENKSSIHMWALQI